MVRSLDWLLTPAQTLHCQNSQQAHASTQDGNHETKLKRIQSAFARSTGAGLVQLAAEWPIEVCDEITRFWRDFAKNRLSAELSGLPTELNSEDLAKQLALAPTMRGGEYLSGPTLAKIWQDVGAMAQQLPEQCGTTSLQEALTSFHPSWDHLGRICLSLAENRSNADFPFAILATYTTRLAGDARPKHRPLAKALKDQATSGKTGALERITQTLQQAATHSAWLADWVASRKIFQAQALSVAEAYEFLQTIPALENAGILVRLPDWWQPSGAPRPQVQVTLGSNQPSGTGAAAMLDFKVEVSLLGQVLTPEEWKTLSQAVDGLVFLRGRWVEANPELLNEVLKYWRTSTAITNAQGISFGKAMRLLVGGGPGGNGPQPGNLPPCEDYQRWSDIVAGPWLTEALRELQEPSRDLGPSLKEAGVQAVLRDYQRRGVAWLERLDMLGLGGCLADDMGLGKTLQVLAYLAYRRRRQPDPCRHLVVAPATLLPNWLAEAARFTPQLRTFAAHPSAQPSGSLRRRPQELGHVDLVVTTYGALQRYPWLLAEPWGMVALDEAQAIKNPETQQTQAVKQLTAQFRVALTGTPVENRPLDLWSIFDFINPGLLGSSRQFLEFLKTDDTKEPPKALRSLRTLVQPYILRRLKTDRSVVADLPAKTELEVTCALMPAQAALYQRVVSELRRDLATVEGIQRRGIVLAALLKLKQICDHPCLAIGHGDFAAKASGKLLRVIDLAEEIAARQEKLLIFTQFREMTGVLARELSLVFGREGAVLHGDTPIPERKALVDAFQAEAGLPFFVLSLKAGGTGLTLTAANHVIHFDRWWNPAVEDQATDRAYRLGQKRAVLVHKLVCAGTIEAKVAGILAEKRGLARDLLGGSVESSITELSNDDLLALLQLDLSKFALDSEQDGAFL